MSIDKVAVGNVTVCTTTTQEFYNIKYLPQEKETHSSTLFQEEIFLKCALAPFCLSRILFISIPKNMSSKHIFAFKETLNNSIFIKNLSWHISFFSFKLLLVSGYICKVVSTLRLIKYEENVSIRIKNSISQHVCKYLRCKIEISYFL